MKKYFQKSHAALTSSRTKHGVWPDEKQNGTQKESSPGVLDVYNRKSYFVDLFEIIYEDSLTMS